MVEWTQRPHRPLDQQLSYETEWDMVNTVSFKKKVHTNGEGKAFPRTSRSDTSCQHCICTVKLHKHRSLTDRGSGSGLVRR